MRARGFTHTSINAVDLEASARFYQELFGLERLPSPDFGFPVVWLRLGDLQLHLFQIDDAETPRYHHLGIDIDDFGAFFERAKALGLVDEETWSAARVLESGEVQLYIRDPAGNLVEINWPDVSTLDPAIATRLRRLNDVIPQRADAASARLYLAPRA